MLTGSLNEGGFFRGVSRSSGQMKRGDLSPDGVCSVRTGTGLKSSASTAATHR